jgi:serine protease Do
MAPSAQYRAAGLLVLAASLEARRGQTEVALKTIEEAVSYKPTEPKLKTRLQELAALLRPSSGTGFVVAEGGYILTNHHVIDGPGKVLVRLAADQEPVPAQVVAVDKERDMALIQLMSPDGVNLTPVPLAAERDVELLEEVAAFGYPLGEAVGSGLKPTRGSISGRPDQTKDKMILLDCRINPGNSGGPVCDRTGRVVGMVTAKTLSTERVESYGLAIPAKELDAFLRMHLKERYKPASRQPEKVEWVEVGRQVGPSVLMILKTRT